MFHAGAVTPSSTFLLQLLTGDLKLPSVAFDEFDPPVSAGLSARLADEAEAPPLALFPQLVKSDPVVALGV